MGTTTNEIDKEIAKSHDQTTEKQHQGMMDLEGERLLFQEAQDVRRTNLERERNQAEERKAVLENDTALRISENTVTSTESAMEQINMNSAQVADLLNTAGRNYSGPSLYAGLK